MERASRERMLQVIARLLDAAPEQAESMRIVQDYPNVSREAAMAAMAVRGPDAVPHSWEAAALVRT